MTTKGVSCTLSCAADFDRQALVNRTVLKSSRLATQPIQEEPVQEEDPLRKLSIEELN
jgi:hypothetical protein